MSFRRGVGGTGIAWEEQRPISVLDLATDERITRTQAREEAVGLGISSGLLFPVIHEGQTLAVLAFAGRESRELSEDFLRTLQSLGADLGRFLARRRGDIGMQRLSARETQVLKLASDGLSAPMIAERLVIGPATVKTHFTHIYEKLGVADRSAAVAEAMRQGLIE
jgi:ATP/maltotriose-dependent transcriptional regulator MalT